MGKPRLRGREVTSPGPCSKPSMTELDLESEFLESETSMPSETFAVLARASLPQPHPHPGSCRLIMCVFGFSQTLPCPVDCSPPGPSVHGIFLARTPEWVAISSPRGSPLHASCIFCTVGRFCTAGHLGSPAGHNNSHLFALLYVGTLPRTL